jgi:predicted amidophosphoribosyltransferase
VKPRQRLTTTPCTNCGRTTLNWSRLCAKCSLAADASTSMPSPQSRCAREDRQVPPRHQVGANNLVGGAPVLRRVIHSTEETQ